jgi:hypothetical protein
VNAGEQGRFFFSKPAGLGLDDERIVQKFANQKAQRRIAGRYQKVYKGLEDLYS